MFNGFTKHMKYINIFENNQHRVPVVQHTAFYDHIVTYRRSLDEYFKLELVIE